MINAQEILFGSIHQALTQVYNIINPTITFQKTRKEFEGDFTLVTFPFIKETKKSPEQLGQELGEYLIKNNNQISAFNVVKGFLNISLSNQFWLNYFNSVKDSKTIGYKAEKSSGKTIMLEYSSPNTNKPLHLGHVRNNLLGFSVAQVLKANGHNVIKVNLVNDRGIHICKSMLAWQKFGNGETPASSGLKGDFFVGKYYVAFDKAYKKEIEDAKNIALQAWVKIWAKKPIEKDKFFSNAGIIALLSLISSMKLQPLDDKKVAILEEVFDKGDSIDEIAKTLPSKHTDFFDDACYEFYKYVKEEIGHQRLQYNLIGDEKKDFEEIFELVKNRLPLIREAQDMLRKWEAGDTEVVDLWKTMNGWVYEGFAVTYKTLGVDFDKMYYESNTYLLGKEIIKEGLAKNVFYKKENGSVAIDLSADGLDEKIVLRSDGTSVYITQDLGTAIERFKEFPQLSQLIYTVGNEQDYHFKVLFKILEKLGYSWAKECYHLSYGMVELPEGKMKSREGTVVDADELLAEMFDTATATTKELGKVDDFSDEEFNELSRTIGLGALKYFILKVDPKKKMLFDPKESIDFNGHTGPFIQWTHARIKSILRKTDTTFEKEEAKVEMNALEKEIVKLIYDFESIVDEAGAAFNPALIANYIYEVTKLFNRFYHDYPGILKEEDLNVKNFRLQLSKLCAQSISNAMSLLGIVVPEKM